MEVRIIVIYVYQPETLLLIVNVMMDITTMVLGPVNVHTPFKKNY
jgi:hypothetical protein